MPQYVNYFHVIQHSRTLFYCYSRKIYLEYLKYLISFFSKEYKNRYYLNRKDNFTNYTAHQSTIYKLE